jgi:phage terminase small subunit
MADRPLTLKQEIFCRKYIEQGGNASEAFRQAYPVEKWKPESVWPHACRLMTNGKVRARITQLTREAALAAAVTPERIIAEYARLAFMDPRQVFDARGKLKPIHDLDDNTAAAIAGIEQEDIWEGKGEGRENVGQLKKIKLSDKRAALDSLAKCLGMFTDRVELTGKDGGPLEVELAARLAAGRARVQAQKVIDGPKPADEPA